MARTKQTALMSTGGKAPCKQLSRTKKLLIALHDKNSLLRYLANMPVQLMPEVMEFLQLEDDLRKRMSMMVQGICPHYTPTPVLVPCQQRKEKRKGFSISCMTQSHTRDEGMKLFRESNAGTQ
jgi:hypothetical protein